MAVIDEIVKVETALDLSTSTQENYGTLMIVKEFDEFDTVVPFQGTQTRHRVYYSPDDAVNDGWGIESDVWGAVNRAFVQTPNTGSVVLGRKDSADSDWNATLTAINEEYDSWYGLNAIFDVANLTTEEYKTEIKNVCDWIETHKKINVIATSDEGCIGYARAVSAGYVTTGLLADVSLWNEVTAGSINITIDGGTKTEITGMDFSSAIDLDAVATVIDTAVTTEGVTVEAIAGKLKWTSDTTGKTSSVLIETSTTGTTIYTLMNMSFSTIVAGYDAGSTPNGTTGVTGNADIFTFLSAYGYQRSMGVYNPNEQDDQHATADEFQWLGVGQLMEAFPFDPASQTWAYKEIEGVTPLETSPSVFAYISDASVPRYGNIYTIVKDTPITYHGRAFDNTPFDVVRGIDWFNDLIQTRIFQALTIQVDGSRKIPATSAGIAIAENILKGVFTEGAVNFLDGDTIVLTMPTVDETDTANRKLDNIKWSARLQGAYENFEISGTITP